jgi:hypothetical protein
VHSEKGCPVPQPTRFNTNVGPKQWGVWLRAEDQRRKPTGGGFEYKADGSRQYSGDGEKVGGGGVQGNQSSQFGSSGKRGNPDFCSADNIQNLGAGVISYHMGEKSSTPSKGREYHMESCTGGGKGKKGVGETIDVGMGSTGGLRRYEGEGAGPGLENEIETSVQPSCKQLWVGPEKVGEEWGSRERSDEASHMEFVPETMVDNLFRSQVEIYEKAEHGKIGGGTNVRAWKRRARAEVVETQEVSKGRKIERKRKHALSEEKHGGSKKGKKAKNGAEVLEITDIVLAAAVTQPH